MATTERMGVDPLAAMDRMAEAAKFERDDHKYHRADIAGWWDRLFIDTSEARAAVAELVAAASAIDRLRHLDEASDAERKRLTAALAPFSEAGR